MRHLALHGQYRPVHKEKTCTETPASPGRGWQRVSAALVPSDESWPLHVSSVCGDARSLPLHRAAVGGVGPTFQKSSSFFALGELLESSLEIVDFGDAESIALMVASTREAATMFLLLS